MPSEETRRVLKVFGVAVTSLEDATTAEDRAKWSAEVSERLREVHELVDRLRGKK